MQIKDHLRICALSAALLTTPAFGESIAPMQMAQELFTKCTQHPDHKSNVNHSNLDHYWVVSCGIMNKDGEVVQLEARYTDLNKPAFSYAICHISSDLQNEVCQDWATGTKLCFTRNPQDASDYNMYRTPCK